MCIRDRLTVNDGAIAEIVLKHANIDIGGHEDDSQMAMTAENVSQDGEEEVGVTVALVDFVDNDVGRAGHEGRTIGIKRPQQNAVGAKCEQRSRRYSGSRE